MFISDDLKIQKRRDTFESVMRYTSTCREQIVQGKKL